MNKIIALGATILTQFYYLCKTYLAKQKKKKLLGLIATLQVLSPNQLCKKILSSQSKGGFQLCKGMLFAGQPCFSVLNPQLKVAYSALFQGEFRTITSKSELLKITEPSFMQLKDELSKLKLYESHSSVMFPTRILRFKVQSIFQKFFDTINHIFNRTPKTQKLSLSEFYSYQNVYELFLPQGSQCTVLGQFSVEGSEVVCNNPKMMFQNEKQMMEYVQQSVKNFTMIQVVLGIGLGVCIALLLKQIYRMFKNMRRKVQNSSTFANVRRIFQNSRICTSCHKNLSCIYYVKCRHMVVCEECQKKSGSVCQLCDSKDGEWVEMFVC